MHLLAAWGTTASHPLGGQARSGVWKKKGGGRHRHEKKGKGKGDLAALYGVNQETHT